MYLTYEEYTDMGGTLDETTFNRYEFEAENLINWYTFDRLVNDDTVDTKVKKCMYMLIVLLKEKYDTLNLSPEGSAGSPITGQIASQSNDGVSVSYVTLSSYNLLNFCKQEIVDTIKQCLHGAVNSLGRKLLYRGLYPGE